MNVTTAARQVYRSRRVLYYWMAEGKLPFTITNGSRQVQIEDVQRLTEKRAKDTWNDAR